MSDLDIPAVDLDLDPVIAAWLTACREWNAQIAELTEKRDRAIELLKAAMGPATEARIGGKPVVSWVWSRPATYIDKKALEKDLPDVAARYTREKAAARPFKILEVKE